MTFMDGHSYTDRLLRAINNELQRFIMTKTGDKAEEPRIMSSPNPNTLRCVILDAKCRVDFNDDDSLCKVPGFNKIIYSRKIRK